MENYTTAIIVFALGFVTTAWLIAYIAYNSLRFKNSDPFEGEQETLQK